jgi:hypothetical protein
MTGHAWQHRLKCVATEGALISCWHEHTSKSGSGFLPVSFGAEGNGIRDGARGRIENKKGD